VERGRVTARAGVHRAPGRHPRRDRRRLHAVGSPGLRQGRSQAPRRRVDRVVEVAPSPPLSHAWEALAEVRAEEGR
jgi:hypothetical protein